jgi:hypothetical protein
MVRGLFILTAGAALVGCASMFGTPEQRAAQNASMSSYSLCSKLAVAIMAPSQVREEWAWELQRRGENCSQYSSAIAASQQQNAQMQQLGQQLLNQNRPGSTVSAPTGPVGFLKREYVSGFNKICVYDRLGSEYAMTISAVALCPMSVR